MRRAFRHLRTALAIFAAAMTVESALLCAQAPARQAGASNAAKARFRAFLDRDWKYWMTEYPEFATIFGYPGQNGRWTDYSPAAIERRNRHLESSLKELHAIRRADLPDEEQLNSTTKQLGVTTKQLPPDLIALATQVSPSVVLITCRTGGGGDTGTGFAIALPAAAGYARRPPSRVNLDGRMVHAKNSEPAFLNEFLLDG